MGVFNPCPLGKFNRHAQEKSRKPVPGVLRGPVGFWGLALVIRSSTEHKAQAFQGFGCKDFGVRA